MPQKHKAKKKGAAQPQHARPQAQTPQPRSGDTEEPSTPLEERPRTELYELAHRLEIAGCAEMSKAELIEAIRRR